MGLWEVCEFILIVAALLLLRTRNRKQIPRGPWAWPVLGNGPGLFPAPHLALCKWAEKYGAIYTVYFGSNRTIVLSDPNLVREAFSDTMLTGRPDDGLFNLYSDGPHGVINSQGEEWVEQRRFTIRHLRDFGFGKKSGEDLITHEINELIHIFEKDIGHPISVKESFMVAVLNTLCMITYGVRYEQDDPKILTTLKILQTASENLTTSPFLFAFPRLSKYFPKLTGYGSMAELTRKVREIFTEQIDRHRMENCYISGSRDFIDSYLREIEATTDPNSSFYKTHGLQSLVAVVVDLFVAGSETTPSTLSWIVLYLTKFTKVQEKVQAELDEVIGKSRMTTLNDRPRLPYTEAVIAETMRISSVVPFGLIHTAMNDVQFHGYDIPRGTYVIANFYYIHHDKRIWSDPEKFQPERFLSTDGEKFKQHDALMPFSTGKRACLGGTLARDSLFLYFTHIFHRFSLRLAEESKNVGLNPAAGFVMGPQDFKIILTKRI